MAASILNTICDQRRKDVAVSKDQVSLEDLKSQIDEANKEFPSIDFKTRLREDAVTESDNRQANMANAPAQDGGLFLVPKVIE